MRRSLCLILTLTFVTVPFAVGSPEARLAALKLELPTTSSPVANYVPVVRAGNLLFLAGHIARDEAGKPITGKAGASISDEAAKHAARAATLGLLATLKQELGELGRVKRIVKVGGFVNASPDYTQHSLIMNGCSDLLVEVFGDAGRHARSAIGVASLPLGAAVEIELVVEIQP